MPFAEMAGDVARTLEQTRQRHRLWVEPVHLAGRAILRRCANRLMHAEPGGEPSGREGHAARRTDRTADIKLIEFGPLTRELVKVWRIDQFVAVAAQISPAPIVGQNEDDVGRAFGGGDGAAKSASEGKEKEGEVFHGVAIQCSRSVSDRNVRLQKPERMRAD